MEEDDDDDGEIDWSKVGVGIGGSDEAIGDADEDDHELAMSLQRSREAAQNKAKSSYKPDVATLVADKVKEEEDGAGNDLTFTTTSEFCRALQGAKAHVPAAVKEEKIKAAHNHSTGVIELVKRAGEVLACWAWFAVVCVVALLLRRRGCLCLILFCFASLFVSCRGVFGRVTSPKPLYRASLSVSSPE